MATNFVKATYQEIYDVNTVSENVSVIGIHTPTGSKPRQMLAGYFLQYRKYKYLGCSVVATPAAKLPLDVMNIALEAGQQGADPRDIFNPMLFRGCHGDNLNSALNSIYKGSFTQDGSTIGKDDYGDSVAPTGGITWEQMYYRMLQDPSFKKFKLSNGLALRGLHPMIYNVASNHQILPNENNASVGSLIAGTVEDTELGFDSGTRGSVANGNGGASTIYPQFMTNRLIPLGWMDTKQVLNSRVASSGIANAVPVNTVLPRIMMGVLVMPPAYRVSTALRFVVTHYWQFKEFNTSLTLEGANEYYNWLSEIVPSTKSNDTLSVKDGDVEIVSDGVM